MYQTRWHSLVEALISLVTGLMTMWVMVIYLIPFLWEIPLQSHQEEQITMFIFLVYICHHYFLRRMFNRTRKSLDVVDLSPTTYIQLTRPEE